MENSEIGEEYKILKKIRFRKELVIGEGIGKAAKNKNKTKIDGCLL